MGMISGDLLAREFEAGQSMGGGYPCHCGASAEDFSNPSKVLKPCFYCCMQQRFEEFKDKPDQFTYNTKDLSVGNQYSIIRLETIIIPILFNMKLH